MSQRLFERTGGYSLTENAQGFLRTGFFDDELLVALEVCVYAVAVWWFTRRSRGRDDRLLLAFLVGVSGLAAGHLAKFAQSVLTAHPDLGRYEWYFVPAYLMMALAVPARCCVAVWFVRRFLGPELRRVSRIPSLGIVAAGAVFLFAAADFTAPFRFVDQRREDISRDWKINSHMGRMVMDRMLPEDSVIGSWDSGVVGYFSRFPVVNLDGLVNSWDYLRALKDGTAAAFRQRYGITHLANMLPGRRPPEDTLFEGLEWGGRRRRFRLWSAVPPGKSRGGADRAAWFWERMEPHFERRSDGVGLLVEGRLAQAFVQDCTVTVAEWTWAGQEEPVRTSWTRMSVGFCASALALPHDAFPPVRAAALTADEYLADRVGGHRPAIDADFDVYLVENRLIYVKEGCVPDDVAAPFFVAVVPIDPDDLPGPRRPHGFENFDFRFDEFGAGRSLRIGGVCAAEAPPLPAYGVAAIHTGQFVMDEEGGFHHLWEGEIRPGAVKTGDGVRRRLR